MEMLKIPWKFKNASGNTNRNTERRKKMDGWPRWEIVLCYLRICLHAFWGKTHLSLFTYFFASALPQIKTSKSSEAKSVSEVGRGTGRKASFAVTLCFEAVMHEIQRNTCLGPELCYPRDGRVMLGRRQPMLGNAGLCIILETSSNLSCSSEKLVLFTCNI